MSELRPSKTPADNDVRELRFKNLGNKRVEEKGTDEGKQGGSGEQTRRNGAQLNEKPYKICTADRPTKRPDGSVVRRREERYLHVRLQQGRKPV